MSKQRLEPIALVGLSCLFPDADGPAEFWRNLLDGRDSTSLATSRELGVEPALLYDPRQGVRDRSYWLRGGYVRNFQLNPAGFHLPTDEIAQFDEVTQWTLHVTRGALRDAGLGNEPGNPNTRIDHELLRRCGLVLGNLSFPTRSSHRTYGPLYVERVERALQELLDRPDLRLPQTSGTARAESALVGASPAGVASRALGLGGPSFCLDAACASSLYAIALASEYLRAGKADLMLAGAVSCADPLFVNMGFSIFRAFPPEGAESRPLDRRSSGLVAGEGAGIVALKRYADALRDGDRIYAVVRGAGLSNDGRGRHVLQPRSDGQVLAFERAYAAAGIDPRDVHYLECHATGTPAGDVVELNTIERFFGERGQIPLIGSVKSNFGHLLTAAGAAGTIKAALAMNVGQIPPTIRVEEPLASEGGTVNETHLVRRTTPWPSGTPRRVAGISAFGFGGTNAHLILESPNSQVLDEPAVAPTLAAMAITGMAAHVGQCDDLSTFKRAIYEGRLLVQPLPEQRWKALGSQRAASASDVGPPPGAYLEGFDLDFLHYRIPPNPDDQPIAQQLLLLSVADAALRDAGVREGAAVAVVVAMQTELELHRYHGRVDLDWQVRAALRQAGIALSDGEEEALTSLAKESVFNAAQVNQYASFIGNIMATRVASQWDFSGPAFTISESENAAFRALEVAQLLLAGGTVDTVLVAGVELAGSAESATRRAVAIPAGTAPGMSVGVSSGEQAGWLPGEGAAAVVLRSCSDARDPEERVYATVEAVSLLQGKDSSSASPTAADAIAAAQQALNLANVLPSDIGYLEASASGIRSEDEAETSGLVAIYGASGRSHDREPGVAAEPSCAFGSVKAGIGHTFAAAGLFGVVKTALCLHGRFIPAVPAWEAPAAPEQWIDGPFYFPAESRPWLSSIERPRRLAAVNGLCADGTAAHVVLAEPGPTPEAAQRDSVVVAPSAVDAIGALCDPSVPWLLPVLGNDLEELLSNLDALEMALRDGVALPALAEERCRATSDGATSGARYVIAFKEIERARAGVPPAMHRGGEWSTPAGSCFASHPLYGTGGIAFVYSGGISAYPGLGRDLLRAYPQLHDVLTDRVLDPALAMSDRLLYPRQISRPAAPEAAALERRLVDDAFAVAAAGASFSLLSTTVLRDVLGVQPQAALGFSLGEASMMLALGAWSGHDLVPSAINASNVLGPRISGPKGAARDAWNVPASIPGDGFWQTFLLLASPADVADALQDEPRAFLTITATEKEVFIVGDPAACRRVIARLGCGHTEAPFNYVLHCPPVVSELPGLERLYHLPVIARPPVIFHTAAGDSPLDLESGAIAQSIAGVVCRHLDFPSLIERAYSAGARLFIEQGPGSACSRWIRTILKDRPHAAVSIDQKGTDGRVALLRLIARLLSHRVPVRLESVLPPPPSTTDSKPARRLVQRIVTGGPSIHDVIVTEDNIRHFRPLAHPRTSITPTATPPPLDSPAVPASSSPPSSPLALPAIPPPLTFALSSASVPAPRVPGESEQSLLAGVLGATYGAASRNVQMHLSLIDSRRDATRAMAETVQWQFDLLRGVPSIAGPLPTLVSKPPLPATDARPTPQVSKPPLPATDARPTPQPIWGENDLLEFAGGSIARVFGPEYAPIDSYTRRVKLPLPPYLLVSRVTKLQATRGVYRPSTITTEYDIPVGAWYCVDGQVPCAVTVESGQCDLLLISYLGIDFDNRGERVYRLLDCTLIFLDDLPLEGQTLRYDISINSFARNGDQLLFFFSYECFVGEKMVLKMEGGCAGFFTDDELEQGRGVLYTDAEREARERAEKRSVRPLLVCRRQTFDERDVAALGEGDLAACFGTAYEKHGRNPSLRLPPPALRMFDRIVSLDREGGAWGLGTVLAEKDLHPDDWYFPCHFQGDEVLAGSLMAEGCVQLLQFFLLYLGCHVLTTDARFQPIRGLPQIVRCRGQVTPAHSKLTYRLEVTDLGFSPAPYAVANVEIVVDGKVVVHFKDLGLRLAEDECRREHRLPPEVRKPALYDERHIDAFATGRMADCFGPEFAVYDGRRVPRQPNDALQLISRIVEVQGTRLDFSPGSSVLSEYDVPGDPWFIRQNSGPDTPYSILMELALQPCGFLSAWLGSTLLYPNEEFYFRNLDGKGHLLAAPDLRGKTVRNRVRLISSTAMHGVIIQKFTYEMSCDGQIFFVGDAAFGHFSGAALVNQVGLDGGQLTDPWHLLHAVSLDLRTADRRLFDAHSNAPHYRLAGESLDLLDRVIVEPAEGRHQQGYVFGSKTIDPNDWFYACHFYQDPVMPGSLGVQAMIEALQAFALHVDLGSGLHSPRFTHPTEHTVTWKYRGQIVLTHHQMTLEAHVKRIERTPGRVTLVADGSLWRDRLRIYEVADLAITLEETPAHRRGEI